MYVVILDNFERYRHKGFMNRYKKTKLNLVNYIDIITNDAQNANAEIKRLDCNLWILKNQIFFDLGFFMSDEIESVQINCSFPINKVEDLYSKFQCLNNIRNIFNEEYSFAEKREKNQNKKYIELSQGNDIKFHIKQANNLQINTKGLLFNTEPFEKTNEKTNKTLKYVRIRLTVNNKDNLIKTIKQKNRFFTTTYNNIVKGKILFNNILRRYNYNKNENLLNIKKFNFFLILESEYIKNYKSNLKYKRELEQPKIWDGYLECDIEGVTFDVYTSNNINCRIDIDFKILRTSIGTIAKYLFVAFLISIIQSMVIKFLIDNLFK